MRVKKHLALTLAAVLATTMLTACPWDIEDDTASDSSSAPSSSSRPSYDEDEDDTVTYTITVQPSAYGTASASAASVTAGGSVTITVTPEEGYEVDTVTANGVTLTANPDGSYTISNIQADQNVQVTFFKTSNFVTAKDRETIRQKLEEIKESDDFKNYNVQTLTLTPDDEAFLADWYEDVNYDDWYANADETCRDEVEKQFGVELYEVNETIDVNEWKEGGTKRWVFACAAGRTYDNEGDWMRSSLASAENFQHLLNTVGQNYTYSMGFFTAEDTEEGEVYLVVILQCDPKTAVAAPVT